MLNTIMRGPALAAALVLSLCGTAAAQADGSGSSWSATGVIEERTVVAVFGGLGLALVLMLATGMIASGDQQLDDDKIYKFDHIITILGQAGVTPATKEQLDTLKKALASVTSLDLGASAVHRADELPTPTRRVIDRFFEHDLTDQWLLDALGPASAAVPHGAFVLEFETGWRACCRSHDHISAQQELKYNAMRTNLRDYIREELFIRGQLEPFYSKPAALALKRLFRSAISLFDFGSDVAACWKMFAQVGLYGEYMLAASSLVCLTLSSVFSTLGVCFFVCCTTRSDETRRADFEEMRQRPMAYFCVAALALTNPEMLVHVPWHNQKAVHECNGLPSVRCALFCAIASVLEDIPQVILQLIYVQRTTGFSQASDLSTLPWQLQLSLAMSIISLIFRVGLRLFIALLQRMGTAPAPTKQLSRRQVRSMVRIQLEIEGADQGNVTDKWIDSIFARYDTDGNGTMDDDKWEILSPTLQGELNLENHRMAAATHIQSLVRRRAAKQQVWRLRDERTVVATRGKLMQVVMKIKMLKQAAALAAWASMVTHYKAIRDAEVAPAGPCRKNRPSATLLWPWRHTKIEGKSFNFYDSDSAIKKRGSSIDDVTGCAIGRQLETFTYDAKPGTYHVVTLTRMRHAELPDLTGRFGTDGVARVCFFEEGERDKYATALTNLAAGRPWNVNAPLPTAADATTSCDASIQLGGKGDFKDFTVKVQGGEIELSSSRNGKVRAASLDGCKIAPPKWPRKDHEFAARLDFSADVELLRATKVIVSVENADELMKLTTALEINTSDIGRGSGSVTGTISAAHGSLMGGGGATAEEGVPPRSMQPEFEPQPEPEPEPEPEPSSPRERLSGSFRNITVEVKKATNKANAINTLSRSRSR